MVVRDVHAKLRLRIQHTGTRIGGCAVEYSLEPNLVATRASRCTREGWG
jgi:hypothetical protein